MGGASETLKPFYEYLETNKSRFLEELKALLKIPSVSADPQYGEQIIEAAGFVRDALEEAGADKVELIKTAGNPVVYGEKIIDPDLPTVLVYGHYDVQPADPVDLWHTPPFEPVIQNEKIYARGASDDKGQMYIHIKVLEAFMATGTLPCNIKMMIEGEEEVGSANLDTFIEENKEKLRADVVMISDTSMISNADPSVTIGLRGLAYHEIEVSGPARDLHSGVYGGAVENPAIALANMLSKLKDENNRIAIPGFYDDVRTYTDEEKQEMNRVPFSDDEFARNIDIPKPSGEKDYSTLERLGVRPCLDINGIWGGYEGEGAKTVLPAKAGAKVSMRLVPNQDHKKIEKLFEDYIHQIAPDTVKVSVKTLHGGAPALIPIDSPGIKAAGKAFEDCWGKKPIFMRSGASIPIVALFQKTLGLDSVLLGFGLDEDNIHSPNENFGLFNFYKGLETVGAFYHHFTNND